MPDLPFGLSITPTSPAGAASSSNDAITNAGVVNEGIVSPFRRSANDIVTAQGIALLKNNMKRILGIRSDSEYSTGELPWRTDFGSLLHILRHRPNDIVTQELARIYVVEALARWEPRIVVTNVSISREIGPDANTQERPILLIRIGFDIRAIRGGAVVVRGESLSLAA